MPTKIKSRTAGNQHDKRHESGLAPPGKRVTKKHSNGHLNGGLDGKPVSSAQPSAHPSSSSGSAPGSASLPSPDALEAFPSINHADHAASPECAERDRTYSDASLDEGGPCGEMGDANHEHAAVSPIAESQLPVFNHATSTNAGSTISTILHYYPLRDAISILILLLSLPPTLVLVIQTLFASLTFVPPTTSISLSTLPNFKEMFNSPNLGYPALATILIVDLIFWVCWLPVWKPIQGIFLDLSQAVIAVSLSGASASTGGPTYSIATTTVIVCVVHVLRYRAIHLTALDYLRSVIHKVDIGIQVNVPSFVTSYASPPPVERGWIYTVVRTILGIHIVSQGVTTCIRHSLVKANEQSANIPAITKSDSDAPLNSESNGRPSAHLAEPSQHGAAASSSDGRAPGPSPARRDSRPRESTAKKKKKLADRIRSRQPLWAAIASTRVTFVKDMEQRNAFDDEREAARMHTNTPHPIASNTTNTPTARVWIRDVRDTEIFFSVQLSADAAVQSINDLEEGSSVAAGVDKSKPFYVRINGATWSSTRIMLTAGDEHSEKNHGERYDGEIFGLAPMSTYMCEIVSIASQDVLCSSSIITQPAPTPEQAASASAPPQHQALRPSSPITTLKQSIQTAEAKLNETRNRGKKSKKDQRAVLADFKRELNTLKGKLDTSGGTDDKQERRLLQITQHKTQAEEATAELKERIDAMGEIPSDELAESEAKRSNWQSASDAKRVANKDTESAKAEVDRELNALKSEIYSAESKKEKLASRRSQRTQEHDKLVSKQEADMTAKQKRDFERAQILSAREKEEHDMHKFIASYEAEHQLYQQKTQDAYQQIAALQSWQSGQPPPYPGYSSPPTPEGMISSAANGALASPQANGFPMLASHPFQSPFHSAHASLNNNAPTAAGATVQPGAPRGRSSSMLSQYSGFTDNGEESSFAPDQPRPQYSWPMTYSASAGAPIATDRKQSESSASNSQSTGSNSPRPDARAFVPGKGVTVGTIGPPGKVGGGNGNGGGSGKAPVSPVAAQGGIGANGR